jgi:D-alanyl-D-alanine carboxypeptidase
VITKSLAALTAATGLIAVGVVPAATQAATPHRPPSQAQLQRALDESVNARVPGAVLVTHHHGHTVRVAAGVSDVQHRTPMRTGDRFRIGSLTTAFVATRALQLVAEQRLSLDDTVDAWLPGAVNGGGAVTVRQLLNMRSGLYDYVEDKTFSETVFSADPTRRWAPQELVAVANGHEPVAAPDVGFSYCDTCYVLLGQIIERATGHPLGDELRERVFKPAGLHATSLDAEVVIAGHHARGYERVGRSKLKDYTAVSPSYAWAAGAIVSTADDVARFYRALYGGRLLRADLVKTMQGTRPMSAELKGWGYGLGVIGKPFKCGTVYGNDGAAPGYTAYAYNSADGAHQGVILINAGDTTMDHEDNGNLQDLLERSFCTG